MLVTGDDFFKVSTEVRVECNRRVALSGFLKDIGDGTTAAMGRADHSNRPVVFLLDNHLIALLNFLNTARTSRASSASVIRTVIIFSIIAVSCSSSASSSAGGRVEPLQAALASCFAVKSRQS